MSYDPHTGTIRLEDGTTIISTSKRFTNGLRENLNYGIFGPSFIFRTAPESTAAAEEEGEVIVREKYQEMKEKRLMQTPGQQLMSGILKTEKGAGGYSKSGPFSFPGKRAAIK
jgi:hypothetical protein